MSVSESESEFLEEEVHSGLFFVLWVGSVVSKQKRNESVFAIAI
jgi:hypothetical protein